MARSMIVPSHEVEAHYDSDGDVLYLLFGDPHPGYGDEGPHDIIFRFAELDDAPIGATVIGYSALGWPKQKGELAKIVGRHLKVDPMEVLMALKRIGL